MPAKLNSSRSTINSRNNRGSGTRPIIFMTSDMTNDWNGQSRTQKSILYTFPSYLDLPYRNPSPLLIEESAQMGGSDQNREINLLIEHMVCFIRYFGPTLNLRSKDLRGI